MNLEEAKEQAKKITDFYSQSVKNMKEDEAELYVEKVKAVSGVLSKQDITQIPFLQQIINSKRTEIRSETQLKNKDKLTGILDETQTQIFREFNEQLNKQNEEELKKWKDLFDKI